MKKKIILIIIVISFFIGIVVLNNNYVNNNYFADHLICELKDGNEYYKDTFDFMYVKDIAYKFNRTEEYKSTGKGSLDDAYKFYVDLKKEYDSSNSSDLFTLKLEYTENESLKVSTFIKALNNEEMYKEYFSDLEIEFSSTMKDIEKKLSDKYNCRYEKEW